MNKLLFPLLLCSTSALAAPPLYEDETPDWERRYPAAQRAAHVGSGLCVVSSTLAVAGTLTGAAGGKERLYSSLIFTAPAAITAGSCGALLHGQGLRARNLLSAHHGRTNRGKPHLVTGLSALGTAALAGSAIAGFSGGDGSGVASIGLGVVGSGALIVSTGMGMAQLRRNRRQAADIHGAELTITPVLSPIQPGIQLAMRF